MADKKLSELTELAATPAVGDELYIRDISEPAPSESKRITVANLVAAATQPTKEFFVPATYGTGALGTNSISNHVVWKCENLNENAYAGFFFPADFSSIIEAVLMVIPFMTNANADWDILSDYGAVGQAPNVHSEVSAVSYNVTNQVIFEVDISGILSSPAAGDYAGIRIKLADAGHDFGLVGVRIKYS